MGLGSTWAVFGIWVAIEACLRLPFILWVRCKLDRNSDGQVSQREAIEANMNFPVTDIPVVFTDAKLYDLTLMNAIRTLLQSFLHAFTYGMLTVLSCNWAFANVDTRFGYLITGRLLSFSLFFMCHVANNGIHVVTSHKIHYVYYLCGYLAMLLFQHGPDPFEIIYVDITWQLATYALLREYTQPSPLLYDIMRVYVPGPSEGEWVLASTPGSPDQWQNAPGSILLLLQHAATFPCYEVLNTHLTASMAVGALLALICRAVLASLLDGPQVLELSLWVSVGAAVAVGLAASFVGPLGRRELALYMGVLRRYYPRSTCVVSSACGAALIVLCRQGQPAASGAVVLVEAVGHTAHLIGLVMVLWAYVAMRRYVDRCCGAGQVQVLASDGCVEKEMEGAGDAGGERGGDEADCLSFSSVASPTEHPLGSPGD